MFLARLSLLAGRTKRRSSHPCRRKIFPFHPFLLKSQAPSTPTQPVTPLSPLSFSLLQTFVDCFLHISPLTHTRFKMSARMFAPKVASMVGSTSAKIARPVVRSSIKANGAQRAFSGMSSSISSSLLQLQHQNDPFSISFSPGLN